jgi:hypothetical protein
LLDKCEELRQLEARKSEEMKQIGARMLDAIDREFGAKSR